MRCDSFAAAAAAATLSIALAAAVPAAADPVAPPHRLAASYLVTWLGFPVYSGTLAAEWGHDRYAMRFGSEALGIVRLVANNVIRWETEGRFRRGRPLPDTFRQANTFRRLTRRIALDYAGDGPPTVSVVPPESPGKRPPVPEPLKAGTIDPLTAVFAAVSLPADATACTYTAKVFEGLRRTDVRLEQAGAERTPDTGIGGFARDGVVCLLHAKRLAGYEPRHFRQAPEPLPPARLWVARHAASGLWIPVMLRFDSVYGPIYARLVRLEVKR